VYESKNPETLHVSNHHKQHKYCDVYTHCWQRHGKHIPAEENARNNRTSTARQRVGKHTPLTIEVVFSGWSVQSGYKEVFSSMKWSEESSFAMPACRDMNLEGEKFNLVESSELAAAE
jgi:hypothetical protein